MSEFQEKTGQRQSDHDLLIRIDTKLEGLIKDNKDYKCSLEKVEREKMDLETATATFKDHENRMRKIEKSLYIATGGLVILQLFLKN